MKAGSVEGSPMLSDADVLDFYERTCAAVYRYASRLVGGDRARAEDLVQETYLTLVRQVRAGRSEPVDVGWAIATCRSRFLDQLRRGRQRDRTALRSFERDGDGAAPDSTATDALARLSDSQRAALVLRYVDDMPVAEVAAAMGRSVHATESLLARARESLRAQFAATEGEQR
jgi:RNA polymerase sigma-70 factor, ECF subfamily